MSGTDEHDMLPRLLGRHSFTVNRNGPSAFTHGPVTCEIRRHGPKQNLFRATDQASSLKCPRDSGTTMTTFFFPPDLQQVCMRLAEGEGILTGVLDGRSDWNLGYYAEQAEAVGLTIADIPAQRDRLVAFLNDRGLLVDLDGPDATVSVSCFASHPGTDPMPPSLVPCNVAQRVIRAYGPEYVGAVPVFRCLVWDEGRPYARLRKGYAVGLRKFRVMPTSWMLHEGIENQCNQALAAPCWFDLRREAIARAGDLEQAFTIRNLATGGEIPEAIIDRDRPDESVRAADWDIDPDTEDALAATRL